MYKVTSVDLNDNKVVVQDIENISLAIHLALSTNRYTTVIDKYTGRVVYENGIKQPKRKPLTDLERAKIQLGYTC